jgi:transposase
MPTYHLPLAILNQRPLQTCWRLTNRLRGMSVRKPYPSDVSDDEWTLVAPYLTLMPEDVGQPEHSLREALNGLRDVIKTGAPWRWMPNDLPPWWRSTSTRSAGWRQAASRRWLRSPQRPSRRRWSQSLAQRCHPGQPHAALLARKRRAGGLRWGPAQERFQAAPGGRHAGPYFGLTRHARQLR